MKNFFSNLFNSKRIALNPENIAPTNASEAIAPVMQTELVSENIFRETNPPTITNEPQARQSGVKAFLSINQHDAGYMDGYNSHSTESMNRQVNILGAHFRQLLECEIQFEESEITNLQRHLAQIGEQFGDIVSQLRLKIDEKLKFINEYKGQLLLSVELEGWLAKPILEYKHGYHKGLSTYLEEKGLLQNYQIL